MAGLSKFIFSNKGWSGRQDWSFLLSDIRFMCGTLCVKNLPKYAKICKNKKKCENVKFSYFKYFLNFEEVRKLRGYFF